MTVFAGKTLSGYCDSICISTFRSRATLERREIKAPATGKTQVSMGFTVVHTAFYNISTLDGTSRVGGVNIVKGTTHMFLTPWRTGLAKLDSAGEHFIRYDGRLFRVSKITNVNEYNKYMLFQVEERGLDTSEESNA